jgi:transcriptional regulator with XRE-family HTH domain
MAIEKTRQFVASADRRNTLLRSRLASIRPRRGRRTLTMRRVVRKGRRDMRTDYMGLRVARWRDIGGMTQQQLADAVGVTREYISMIENGKRPVTKRSLLINLARALKVSIADLTSQPREPESAEELIVANIESGVRTALDEDPEAGPQPSLTEVTAAVRRVRVARMACDFSSLAALLPGLIAQARVLTADSDSERASVGSSAFVAAATDAAFTIKAHGHIDLAIRLADAARGVADSLGEPIEQAVAAFAVAQCALAGGSRRKSLRIATEAAVRLGDIDSDGTLTLYGMLHLHAALSAAALGRAADVAPHLAEATAAAERVTSDPWLQELTPTNVGIWRVAIALENGEPDRAPEYARRVDKSKIRGLDRRATLHIDTGRGLYAADRRDEAVREFLRADEIAPQKVRTRPWVLELVGQMVRDARNGSDELRELAARCRIDPLAEPA